MGHVVAGLAVASLLAAGCGGDDNKASTAQGESSSKSTSTTLKPVIDPGDGGNYSPNIDPANFVDVIDNPYMTLTPGAKWSFEGTSDGEDETDEVVVTDQKHEVMGISATVVRDTVSSGGEVTEDTNDWYAQDKDGNVWYLGEDTKEYENGKVKSTEGSWEGGKDGALPGIIMQAHPEVGQAYRQEYYAGQAEDLAEVDQVGATRSIGLGDYHDVVVIKEWNPLEPDIIEKKYFAPDVGVIYEEAVAGTEEVSELVHVTEPPA